MKLYMLPGYGIAYRTVSRLLHKFDLHYAPLHGPIEPDGTYQRWCKWCGMRDTFYPSGISNLHLRKPDFLRVEKP